MVKKDVDFIYWFNIHIQKIVGMNLKEWVTFMNKDDLGISKKKEELGEIYVWPFSPDGMTRSIKSRMEQAGMPSSSFGFHSFRSGFLTNAILANTNRSQSLDGVLSKVATIAGWLPYCSVEFSYIKNSARAHLICSDIIGITNTPIKSRPSAMDEEEDVPVSHISSMEFHGWEEPIPRKQ